MIPQSATAAVFTEVGQPLTLQSLPCGPLAAGDVLVRVTACTLCGSDLHTISGRRSAPTPTILGHEILGRIAAFVGPAPQHDALGQPLQMGDRVTWSVFAACGDCDRCRRGWPQKCRSLWKYGHEPTHRQPSLSGGLAEYCVLRPGTTIVRLPDSVDDRLACPANCATATVAGALRLAGPVTDRTVLITGGGMLGLTACALARSHGARQVVCVEPDRTRHERIVQFGGIPATADDLVARLRQLTGAAGDGADIFLEFAGAAPAVALGLEHLGIGGRAVLVGSVSPTPAVPVDPERVIRRCWSLFGLHNYTPADLVTAVRFLSDHGPSWPLNEQIAGEGPLHDINRIVAEAEATPGRRWLVRP